MRMLDLLCLMSNDVNIEITSYTKNIHYVYDLNTVTLKDIQSLYRLEPQRMIIMDCNHVRIIIN